MNQTELAAFLAAAARIQPLDHTPVETGADHGPDPDWPTDREADRRCGLDENRSERAWEALR